VGDQLIWFSADWLGQLDEFGIATGAEREELEAKREVWNLFILLARILPKGEQVFLFLMSCWY
jgi:hypothetical protein